MLTDALQVLRWSALGLGVFYGLYHQTAISSAEKMEAAKKDYERKQYLIDQARAAYAEKKAPKESKSSGSTCDRFPRSIKSGGWRNAIAFSQVTTRVGAKS